MADGNNIATGGLTDEAMDDAPSSVPHVPREISLKEKAQALTSVISTTEGPPSIGKIMRLIKLPEGASVSVFLIEFCLLYVWH